MACTTVDSNDACFDKTWPHGEGLQVLAFSPDGRYLYSGGTDALLRAWDTEKPGEDPEKIEHFDEAITSLDCSFDALVACSADGSTATFAFDDGKHEMQTLITRAAPGMQARHAKFGFSGRKIAVASDELLVKIIDTRDTSQIQFLSGHTKSVKAVGWNPEGTLLVTSGSDGTLRVWDVTSSTEQPFCVKTIDGLIAAADSAKPLACAALWHPNGKYFVVGTKSHEIAIIARDSWIRTGDFVQDGHNADITSMAWSPNGNYLASAGADQQLIIWDTLSQSPLLRCAWDERPITALAWQPGNGANTLAISDESGQLAQWRGLIPSTRPHPSDGPAAGVRPNQQVRTNKVANDHQRKVSIAQSEDLMKSDGVEEEDDGDADDGWIDDDMNGAYSDERKVVAKQKLTKLPEFLDVRHNSATYASSNLGQPSFQSGATLFKEKRRYLAFNSVGIIHVVDRDHHNLVTVEFHDRSAHRGYHFEDNFKFDIASLGQRGAAYASVARGNMPSVVNYRPFETWTAQADWQYNLPQGESAVALGVGGVAAADIEADLAPCLGNGTIVVGTSTGYLRFISGSGLQKHLVDLGHEIVNISCGKEWAMVIHRQNNVILGDRQNLLYSIYDCDTYELLQRGDIPTLSKVTLSWAGFTDDDIPAIYKSNGVLSLLDRSRRPGQARWVAALDSHSLERREGKQEAYWAVGVSRTQFQCVILKGEDKQPFFPTPLLQDLPLQIPILKTDEQQDALEESYLRDSLTNGHIKDGCDPNDYLSKGRLNAAALEIDKHLLKLMQAACKADKLEQALEAARLLGQPQSLDAAAKLAGFFHQPGLQERIQLIKEGRTGESAVDRQRKESKWGHLIDNRTVVDSSAEARQYTSVQDTRKTIVNDLSKPIDKTTAKRSLGDASALGAKIVKPLFTRAEDSGHGSSEVEPEPESEPMAVDEDDFQETMDQSEVEQETARNVSDARPKSANPFAKTNKANAPNPFAKKRMAAGHVDLKRSDSFFARVDPESSNAAKTKAGPKQAGLFGMPTKEVEPVASKKGRKRKSATEDDQGAAAKKPKGGIQPGLGSFMKPKEKAADTETQGTTETPPVESQVAAILTEEPESLVQDHREGLVEEPRDLDNLFDDVSPAPICVA